MKTREPLGIGQKVAPPTTAIVDSRRPLHHPQGRCEAADAADPAMPMRELTTEQHRSQVNAVDDSSDFSRLAISTNRSLIPEEPTLTDTVMMMIVPDDAVVPPSDSSTAPPIGDLDDAQLDDGDCDDDIVYDDDDEEEVEEDNVPGAKQIGGSSRPSTIIVPVTTAIVGAPIAVTATRPLDHRYSKTGKAQTSPKQQQHGHGLLHSHTGSQLRGQHSSNSLYRGGRMNGFAGERVLPHDSTAHHRHHPSGGPSMARRMGATGPSKSPSPLPSATPPTPQHKQTLAATPTVTHIPTPANAHTSNAVPSQQHQHATNTRCSIM